MVSAGTRMLLLTRESSRFSEDALSRYEGRTEALSTGKDTTICSWSPAGCANPRSTADSSRTVSANNLLIVLLFLYFPIYKDT